MDALTYLILTITALITVTPLHYGTLLVYQLSSYRVGETAQAFLRIKAKRYLLPVTLTLCAYALSLFAYYLLFPRLVWLIFLPTVVESVVLCYFRHKKAKIALKLTKRLMRFLLAFTLLSTIFGMLFTRLYPPVFPFALCLGGFISLVVTHAVTSPLEKLNNARFVKKAKIKLSRTNLIKIGVTGSYGKTTTKSILTAFLSSKYATKSTTGNYNTPLGIARSVNENLSDNDRVFVAEMGARYKGDIAKLCEIVSPSVGIITAIGNQHLSTFKSKENLIKTKYELIDALPKNGIAVFNGDNSESLPLYKNCEKCKYLSGVKGVGKDAYYEKVTLTEKGTTFLLTVLGKSVEIETPLIGEHIPSTLTQCALTAVLLKINLQKIKRSAKTLKAVAHRLELLYNGNDVIIDDAYNGSKESIENALKTLARFTGKTRVVVTPGVVELGKRQYDINYELGRFCASRCDEAIFTGVNATALRSGAIDGGMDESKVTTVKDLTNATQKLSEIQGERVILFCNDLPDNY